MNEQSTRHLREISDEDIHSGGFRLDAIISGAIDGIIVKDFLSKAEVEKILLGFSNTTPAERIQINSGFDSFPMTFAQFDQMLEAGVLTEEKYFHSSKEFTRTFSTRYGTDVLRKLQDFMSAVSDDIQLDLPYPPMGTVNYVPFTFRELYPEKGVLKAHCENLFYREFPSYFNRINAFSIKENQLSFFVLLQEPEEGGELTLYDLMWNDNQRRISDTEVDLGGGNILSVEGDGISRRKFRPKAGSLVVFSGGEIWHRVEMIKGSKSRITLGGFMSLSPDRSKLFCWS